MLCYVMSCNVMLLYMYMYIYIFMYIYIYIYIHRGIHMFVYVCICGVTWGHMGSFGVMSGHMEPCGAI